MHFLVQPFRMLGRGQPQQGHQDKDNGHAMAPHSGPGSGQARRRTSSTVLRQQAPLSKMTSRLRSRAPNLDPITIPPAPVHLGDRCLTPPASTAFAGAAMTAALAPATAVTALQLAEEEDLASPVPIAKLATLQQRFWSELHLPGVATPFKVRRQIQMCLTMNCCSKVVLLDLWPAVLDLLRN